MRKFISAQRLHDEASLVNKQLLSVFPFKQPVSSSLSHGFSDDKDVLKAIRLSTASLHSIETYDISGIAALLPPLHEDIFSSELLKDLELLYAQLYPHQSAAHVSPFYVCAGRAKLLDQVVGSIMNATSCNSSAVIMAYWPSKGSDLSSVDCTSLNVGTVHYFCRHKIALYDSDSKIVHKQHILAYVTWKQQHSRSDLFGTSATLCVNMDEQPSMCSFLPIQRIHSICAHCVLDVNSHGLNETVFVAVPVPMKFFL